MNRRTTARLLAGLAAAALAVPLVGGSAAGAGGHGSGSGDLARDFAAVDRNTTWTLTQRLALRFPTFHTEGLAVTKDRFFLSAVEILEPTVIYPVPQGGYDRTPGKGIGHLFVIDKQGNLQRDIILGEGDMYHPGRHRLRRP
jgi:hypothetical protein